MVYPDSFSDCDDGSCVATLKRGMTRYLSPDRSTTGVPHDTVFLVGDSYAGSLNAGLSLATRGRYQTRLCFMPTYGFFPVEYMTENEDTDSMENVFSPLYEHLLSQLAQFMASGDVLVLRLKNSFWTGELAARVEQDFLEGIVAPSGGKMLIVGYWWHTDSSCSGTSDCVNASYVSEEEARAIIDPLVSRWNGTASYISLLSLFCDADVFPDGSANCTTHIPGTDINAYWSTDHLSDVGSVYAWPYLCEAMEVQGLM
jgi:hypothetical protein